MLPCQSACPSYQPGCHKLCPRWREFQRQQAIERQAKKRYLKFHLDNCALLCHQLYALQPRYQAR